MQQLFPHCLFLFLLPANFFTLCISLLPPHSFCLHVTLAPCVHSHLALAPSAASGPTNWQNPQWKLIDLSRFCMGWTFHKGPPSSHLPAYCLTAPGLGVQPSWLWTTCGKSTGRSGGRREESWSTGWLPRGPHQQSLSIGTVDLCRIPSQVFMLEYDENLEILWKWGPEELGRHAV